MTAALMNTYQPLALSFTKGLGTRLWDQAGREYLDAVAGVAVTNVGHSHPRIVSAISEQAGLLLHTSNLYSIDWQLQLAKRLTALSGMERAFFNNSGAEANETALKLARLYGWRKGIEQPLVVVMANAFHGRTLGTLSASDGPAVRLGFNELPGISSKCRSAISRRWSKYSANTARASWRFWSNRSRAKAAYKSHRRVISKPCATCAVATLGC